MWHAPDPLPATPNDMSSAAALPEDFNLGKAKDDFRVYDEADTGVAEHYRSMRLNQTVDFVTRMEAKHLSFNHMTASVREMFKLLESFVDRSDPDSILPNRYHMAQCALAARARGEPDHLVFTLLIHDLGKACFLWGDEAEGMSGRADGPQFALGGDTWVVGAKLPDNAVFPQFNALNPDMTHPVYSTEMGMYTPGCGIHALKYAFGHDEYIYRWALHNKVPLPPEDLAFLRFHSCYPMHSNLDTYRRFYAPGDEELLKAVVHANAYDLYTKADALPDFDEVWESVLGPLVDKFAPGQLQW